MKDILDDWAIDPVRFVGLAFCFSIVVMMVSLPLSAVVSDHFERFVQYAAGWAATVFASGLLAVMLIGAVDEGSPGAARLLMPMFCVGPGSVLYLTADSVNAGGSDLAPERIGAVYLVLGAALVVANAQRLMLPRRP
ncbi:hypothetical protein [Vitreimonas flagellata]|uniref:hypothetical protein n=1 Tax=Vitreimonas flagellata TaxID=2560861 RepID=UPI00107587F1|nr:hypothetical protein [Vitreimonas flagellata]